MRGRGVQLKNYANFSYDLPIGSFFLLSIAVLGNGWAKILNFDQL